MASDFGSNGYRVQVLYARPNGTAVPGAAWQIAIAQDAGGIWRVGSVAAQQ
jgi:hypothetical protein